MSFKIAGDSGLIVGIASWGWFLRVRRMKHSISSYFHSTPQMHKPLILAPVAVFGLENKAVACEADGFICYFLRGHVGFRRALERIGREQHLANQQVTCASFSSDSLQRNFTKEHQVQNNGNRNSKVVQ